MDGDISAERAAHNQSLYRSVNERLKDLNETFDDVSAQTGEWICECADTECTRRVTAPRADYEAVRRNGRTFIVYPGHVFSNVERVVASHEHFVIVEKLNDSGEIAEELDPRTP